MMRNTVLAFVFLSVNWVYAQDSALYEVEIPVAIQKFHSTYEAQLFEKLVHDDEVDFLTFFVAADTAGTKEMYDIISAELNGFIAEQREDNITEKPAKKQIKKLYTDVHNRFLDKYELENDFTSIFDDGRYNCVSGSALFAHVFTALNIPYTIEEFPTHVMLIAYPKGDQIAVETTDPADGTLVFTPKMKKEFADELRASKMISEAEYLEGPEAVFQKNYLINDQINFRQLAGIQYYNNAIYQLEKDNFIDALNFGLKSFVLYPSPNSRYAVVTSAASILENGNVKDSNRVRAFAVLSLFKGGEVTDDYLLGHLTDVVNKVMMTSQDTVQFSQACNAMLANSADSVFTQSVSLFYNYEMGRLFALKKDFKTATRFMAKAYASDSINLQVSALTAACIGGWIGQKPLVEAVRDLDSLFLSYPSLANHPDIKKARVESYLRLFGFNYYNGKGTDAEEYRLKFEQLVDQQNIGAIGVDTDLIVSAYKEGAVYYYKKRQYKKAESTLSAALKILPGNLQLERLRNDFR